MGKWMIRLVLLIWGYVWIDELGIIWIELPPKVFGLLRDLWGLSRLWREKWSELVSYIEEWGKQMMSYGCINYLIIAACHDPVLNIITLYTFTILYAFSAGHLKNPNRISANGKSSRYVEFYCYLPLSEVCRYRYITYNAFFSNNFLALNIWSNIENELLL